jgi:hypothetical protein
MGNPYDRWKATAVRADFAKFAIARLNSGAFVPHVVPSENFLYHLMN